jgi:ribosome maturation factor RimP
MLAGAPRASRTSPFKGAQVGKEQAIVAAAPQAQNRALTAVVTPIVARAGLDLEAVTVRAAGRRRQVRIVVDEPGGLSLDRVAGISREISAALDASNVLGDTPYVLEVTSPGVTRPLTLPRHWANALGRLVAVRTRDGREFTARVLASDASTVTLGEVTPDQGAQGGGALALAEIARAVVQVEFSRISEVDLGDDQAAGDEEGPGSETEGAAIGVDEFWEAETGDPDDVFGDGFADDAGLAGLDLADAGLPDPDLADDITGTGDIDAGTGVGQE